MNKNNINDDNKKDEGMINPCILSIELANHFKKLIPVLPIMVISKLNSNNDIFFSLNNTCKNAKTIQDRLQHSVRNSLEEKDKKRLIKENVTMTFMFGFKESFFDDLWKVVSSDFGANPFNIISGMNSEITSKNMNPSVRTINSFFCGLKDWDTVKIDKDIRNNIVYLFLKDTNLEKEVLRNGDSVLFLSNGFREYKIPHRAIKGYFLPTLIEDRDIMDDRMGRDGTTGDSVSKSALAENIEKLLSGAEQAVLKESDFDFINDYVEYDKFETKEGYIIFKDNNNNSKFQYDYSDLCEGAQQLLQGILDSEHCKKLIKRGADISKETLFTVLNTFSQAYCENVLTFLPGDKVDFLKALKECLANVLTYKNEMSQAEKNFIGRISSDRKYGATNFWQSVVVSVFLNFRNECASERSEIFWGFVETLSELRKNDLDIENYLDKSCTYKTQALIKKLMRYSNLTVSESDLDKLMESINALMVILQDAEHATQISFVVKEGKCFCDDALFIDGGYLSVRVDKLLKLGIEHKLISKGNEVGLGYDPSTLEHLEISRISEFKFNNECFPIIKDMKVKFLKSILERLWKTSNDSSKDGHIMLVDGKYKSIEDPSEFIVRFIFALAKGQNNELETFLSGLYGFTYGRLFISRFIEVMFGETKDAVCLDDSRFIPEDLNTSIYVSRDLNTSQYEINTSKIGLVSDDTQINISTTNSILNRELPGLIDIDDKLKKKFLFRIIFHPELGTTYREIYLKQIVMHYIDSCYDYLDLDFDDDDFIFLIAYIELLTSNDDEKHISEYHEKSLELIRNLKRSYKLSKRILSDKEVNKMFKLVLDRKGTEGFLIKNYDSPIVVWYIKQLSGESGLEKIKAIKKELDNKPAPSPSLLTKDSIEIPKIEEKKKVKDCLSKAEQCFVSINPLFCKIYNFSLEEYYEIIGYVMCELNGILEDEYVYGLETVKEFRKRIKADLDSLQNYEFLLDNLNSYLVAWYISQLSYEDNSDKQKMEELINQVMKYDETSMANKINKLVVINNNFLSLDSLSQEILFKIIASITDDTCSTFRGDHKFWSELKNTLTFNENEGLLLNCLGNYLIREYIAKLSTFTLNQFEIKKMKKMLELALGMVAWPLKEAKELNELISINYKFIFVDSISSEDFFTILSLLTEHTSLSLLEENGHEVLIGRGSISMKDFLVEKLDSDENKKLLLKNLEAPIVKWYISQLSDKGKINEIREAAKTYQTSESILMNLASLNCRFAFLDKSSVEKLLKTELKIAWNGESIDFKCAFGKGNCPVKFKPLSGDALITFGDIFSRVTKLTLLGRTNVYFWYGQKDQVFFDNILYVCYNLRGILKSLDMKNRINALDFFINYLIIDNHNPFMMDIDENVKSFIYNLFVDEKTDKVLISDVNNNIAKLKKIRLGEKDKLGNSGVFCDVYGFIYLLLTLCWDEEKNELSVIAKKMLPVWEEKISDHLKCILKRESKSKSESEEIELFRKFMLDSAEKTVDFFGFSHISAFYEGYGYDLDSEYGSGEEGKKGEKKKVAMVYQLFSIFEHFYDGFFKDQSDVYWSDIESIVVRYGVFMSEYVEMYKQKTKEDNKSTTISTDGALIGKVKSEPEEDYGDLLDSCNSYCTISKEENEEKIKEEKRSRSNSLIHSCKVTKLNGKFCTIKTKEEEIKIRCASADRKVPKLHIGDSTKQK